MKKDPYIFIDHILESIQAIIRYTKGIDEENFKGSQEKQDAVIRRLEIIGEAVKHLPEDIKAAHPDIPWREIAGTRDILIHNYFGVDLDLTWQIVINDLKGLEKKMIKLKNTKL